MSGWISVKDRLPSLEGLEPDEGVYVLVCESFDDIPYLIGRQSVSICGFFRDGWSEWDNFGMVCPERITHWMYLPEPPEED